MSDEVALYRFKVKESNDPEEWWVCLRSSFDTDTNKHFLMGANARGQIRTWHEDVVQIDRRCFPRTEWFAK